MGLNSSKCLICWIELRTLNKVKHRYLGFVVYGYGVYLTDLTAIMRMRGLHSRMS